MAQVHTYSARFGVILGKPSAVGLACLMWRHPFVLKAPPRYHPPCILFEVLVSYCSLRHSMMTPACLPRYFSSSSKLIFCEGGEGKSIHQVHSPGPFTKCPSPFTPSIHS